MKAIFWIIFLCPLISFSQSISQEYIESKIKNDLSGMLDKTLEPHQYSLQVTAFVDKVNERQIVEGEQIVHPAENKANVPPLPGFVPPPAPAAPIAGQTRQVFKTVERPVLKSVNTYLILDTEIDSAKAKSIENLVRAYLASAYPTFSHLEIQRTALRASGNKEKKIFEDINWNWAVTALLFVIGAGLIYSLFNRRQVRSPSRVFGDSYERIISTTDNELASSPMIDSALLSQGKSMSLGAPIKKTDKSAFAGIPATPHYADQRRQLLDSFLKNAVVFRLYYGKLDNAAKAELCAALNGPAFQTLMESLKLTTEEISGINPPSEDQIQFYHKNFSEFHEAMRWQDEQFFGFLPHLTEEQVAALVRSQNPVIGALVLKFSGPELAAKVLNQLDSKLQVQLIDQFDRTRQMSPDELREIELSVRASVRTLPNFILANTNLEQEYWSKLLLAAQDPSKVLTSLEQARPDLYQKLAKFRFQLQDIPSLPPPLVKQVLDEIENDEIAKAFSRQSLSLVDYALNELPEARRKLLQAQILSYQNVETQEVQHSISHLTKKFREVLA